MRFKRTWFRALLRRRIAVILLLALQILFICYVINSETVAAEIIRVLLRVASGFIALHVVCQKDKGAYMVTLLSSGKINNRLLCEIATHENFQRLMTDIEIFVDRIADMRIAQMNLVLEATRQEVIRSHAPGENDLYVRTLELGQVQESDFFSHTIHDDLDSIVQDIRQAHVTDRTTADPQPTFTEVKEKFDRAMQLGSNEERVIHEFCDQMQIPFDKIASEDFSAFMRILSLSKLLKNPNNMRGKARTQPYHGAKKKKRR